MKLQRVLTDFEPQDEERLNKFIEDIRKIENVEKMREVANRLMNEYVISGIEASRENLLSIEFKNNKKVIEES